jgi:hypothetical protein
MAPLTGGKYRKTSSGGIGNRPIQVRYLPAGFFKINIRVEKGRKEANIDTRNCNYFYV